MDLLADALSVIHFKGTVYCQTEFRAPWGIDWEQRQGHAGFFMITRGGCYMETSMHSEPISLRAGDFVMSPKAMGYVLRDSLTSTIQRFDDVAGSEQTISTHRLIRYGGQGVTTNLIMGCFELDETSKNPLVQSLPEFIIVKAEDMHSLPWLESTLRFLAFECTDPNLGSSIAIAKLTELLFVQAVRLHLLRQQSCSGPASWLKGAADPLIGKTLSHMHENPETPWTVASLAALAGMSRSAFALRFRELTNTTPLDYLTAWRIHKAEKLISDGTMSLAEIAAVVGYQSESAFSKAFKREMGLAPGVFRRRPAHHI